MKRKISFMTALILMASGCSGHNGPVPAASNPSDASNPPAEPAPPSPGEEAGIAPSPSPSPSPTNTIVYANNWSDITIMANWAKTTMDLAAHFYTSRNACGKDAAGVLDIQVWNKLAQDMNAALEVAPIDDENNCVDAPESYPYMDGNVEVTLTKADLPVAPAPSPSASASLMMAMTFPRPTATPSPTSTASATPTATPIPTPTTTASVTPSPSPSHAPTRTLFEVRGGQICSTIKDPKLSKELLDLINQVVQKADKEECPNGWGSG